MEQVGLSRALCRWIGKQAARIAYEARGRCHGDLEARPARTDSMHEIKELHIPRGRPDQWSYACRSRLHGVRNKVVMAQFHARLRQVGKQIDQINTELRSASSS